MFPVAAIRRESCHGVLAMNDGTGNNNVWKGNGGIETSFDRRNQISGELVDRSKCSPLGPLLSILLTII